MLLLFREQKRLEGMNQILSLSSSKKPNVLIKSSRELFKGEWPSWNECDGKNRRMSAFQSNLIDEIHFRRLEYFFCQPTVNERFSTTESSLLTKKNSSIYPATTWIDMKNEQNLLDWSDRCIQYSLTFFKNKIEIAWKNQWLKDLSLQHFDRSSTALGNPALDQSRHWSIDLPMSTFECLDQWLRRQKNTKSSDNIHFDYLQKPQLTS